MANFTPEFKNYSGQGAFRFWCQSVLPLVYDDSLSYMELLNKVVVYLNNTISDVAAMEDNVDALLNSYNQLQQYVNDYFDNLDVQEEINNKLDGLVEDGTMDELLEPFVTAQIPGLVESGLPGVVEEQIPGVVSEQLDDVVEEQIGGVVAEQIPQQVTDWLDDNVTPVGSAVVVDSSLTIAGAAADAKVVGDGLDDVKNALTLIQNESAMLIPAEFELGGLSDYTTKRNITYRIYNPSPFSFNENRKGTAKTGFKFSVVTEDTLPSAFVTEYTFIANTNYKIQIARQTEDTSETADIDVFKNAIVVTTAFEEQIKKNTSDIASIEAQTLNKNIADGFVTPYSHYSVQFSINADLNTSVDIQLPDLLKFTYEEGKSINSVLLQPAARSLTLPHDNFLIYDITANEMAIVGRTSLRLYVNPYIVCCYNSNGHIKGDWFKYTLSQEVSSIAQEVSSIAQEVSSVVQEVSELPIDKIPSYYVSHLETKTADITEKMMDAGETGFGFMFITDIHEEVNTMNSPALMRYIARNTPVKRAHLNGDYITEESSKPLAAKKITECINAFDDYVMKKTVGVGNHDYNNPDSGSTPEELAKMLSIGEVYPLIASNNIYPIVTDPSLGFYFDDINAKVRFYVLACFYNSQFSVESASYAINDMKSNTNGFDIVILSHVGIKTDGTLTSTMTQFANVLDAYNSRSSGTYHNISYDFGSKTGKVLAIFLGHMHLDVNGTTSGGIPFVATTCDTYNQELGGLTRTVGTITEQAFDTVVVDRNAGKIHCIRIGAGSDRNINLQS